MYNYICNFILLSIQMAWKTFKEHVGSVAKKGKEILAHSKRHIWKTKVTLSILAALTLWLPSCSQFDFNWTKAEKKVIITNAMKLNGVKKVLFTSDGWKTEIFATVDKLDNGNIQIVHDQLVITVDPVTGEISWYTKDGAIQKKGNDRWEDVPSKLADEGIKNTVAMCVNGTDGFKVSYVYK